MDSIYKKICESIDNSFPSWLVTVVGVGGSVPASIGMKMIVYSDGRIAGTVGGGEIEKKIIDKIVNTKPDKTEKWNFDLGVNSDEKEKTGMVCGGTQEVLVESLLSGVPLYIIGGGHCGMALSNLAGKTGFLVTVIDNREEWADKNKHPNAMNTVCCDYTKIGDYINFSDNCFIVIMTYGHIHDKLILEKLIDKKYKYLGMMGSKNKVNSIFDDMIKNGTPADKIKSVFAPIGLDILTHTPDEIAVSIVAQMLAVKNGKDKILLNANPLLEN